MITRPGFTSAPGTPGTAPATAPSPARVLGFWSASALVVASMLGTGVFTTSGFLLADLHSPWLVLGVWLAGGLIALAGALCYGALARHIPESGGEYVFLSRTLHPAAGCIAGWISVLVGFSAPLAAAAQAFGQYTQAWWPGVPPAVTGTVLAAGLTALHAWNVRHGTLSQNAAVLAKLALIALFLGLALARLPHDASLNPSPTPVSPPLPVAAMALVWVSFSYAGWNAAVYVGSEIAQPERTLPRALLAGTLTVTALYLALNAVFVLGTPAHLISGQLEIGRIAAAHLGGPSWANLATLLISLALVTSVSSLVMTGPRVYSRMAEDGFLPSWLRATHDPLHDTHRPPRAGLAFQLALALVMLWTATYQSLLTFIGFTLSLSTAATVVGLIRTRRQLGPGLPVPGWPWLPIAFVVTVLAMTALAIARAPGPSLAGFGVMAAGWLAWLFSHRSRSRVHPTA